LEAGPNSAIMPPSRTSVSAHDNELDPDEQPPLGQEHEQGLVRRPETGGLVLAQCSQT
jgi:hypothetical protein